MGFRFGFETAFVAAGLLFGMAGSACLDIPSYICTGDTQCVAEGVAGACDFSSGICIYPNQACPTLFSDSQGTCMPAANQGAATAGDGVDDGDERPEESADDPDDLDEAPDDGVDDGGTTTPDSDTTEGVDDLGESSSDTTGSALPCGGQPLGNITDEGLVSASSVFDVEYVANNSVDGDLSTSWFSSGPEGAGMPSVFDWAPGQDVCVTTIVVTGNGLHTNPSFQTGYGFETMDVLIYDAADTVVFSQTVDLSGTPDPTQMINVGGVTGRRVSLELGEHENATCGGFSELQVLGA